MSSFTAALRRAYSREFRDSVREHGGLKNKPIKRRFTRVYTKARSSGPPCRANVRSDRNKSKTQQRRQRRRTETTGPHLNVAFREDRIRHPLWTVRCRSLYCSFHMCLSVCEDPTLWARSLLKSIEIRAIRQRGVKRASLKGLLCAGVPDADEKMRCNSREKCDRTSDMRFVPRSSL